MNVLELIPKKPTLTQKPPTRVLNYIEGALNALEGCVTVLDIIEMFDTGRYIPIVNRLKKDRYAILRFAEKLKDQYNSGDYIVFKVRVRMFITAVIGVKNDAKLTSRIDMEFDDGI